jgi:hypothetical protein
MNAYNKKYNNLQNVFGKPQPEIILFKKNYESVNLIWLLNSLWHFDVVLNRWVTTDISIRIIAVYKFLHGSWGHK